ncbi:MAG TPA: hypothetical protein VEX64_05530 [Pyrinomonadaceae bacterium]|nr:hypothetical protein [Pyrinomonadaceae bacterium]
MCAAFLLLCGFTDQVAAQSRDPFEKPAIRGSRSKASIVPGNGVKPAAPVKPVKPVPTVVGAPPIQQRIESYKLLRMRAAEMGVPAPKPTAVLMVSEVDVTGIFRTPRGYAAMVEATPIKLSYTIYPGEKFFDGHLVAIEENRLIFRRETRMTDGKVITLAENKGLKVQTFNEMVVPRVDTATTAAPATNQTVTVPAIAVSSSSAPTEPVLTADNKSTSTTEVISETPSAQPKSDGSRETNKKSSTVNPRSKSSAKKPVTKNL